MKSKVGIVIVTYNSANHIVRLLESLKHSLKIIGKIVIIENNSPEADLTQQAIKKYLINRTTNTRTKFICSSANNGFGRSCNFGAKKIDAEYILFINPDTKVDTDSIRILYEHAVTTSADLIGGKSITFSGKNHLTTVRKPNLNIGLFEFSNLGKLFHTQKGHNDFYYLDRNDVIEAKNDIEVDALGGAYLMIKKSSFEKLGGFDINFFMYLEDVDLSVRAKQVGMKVVYCPHSIIKHIGGASSNNIYRIRHQSWFDSRKYYFRKHFGLFTNLLIQPIYVIEELMLKKIKHL